jgi:hypothetical protein
LPVSSFVGPAALALLVSIPLFGTAQSWWGALPDLAWPLLLVLLAGGAFVVDRINKFPLVLSFTGAHFGQPCLCSPTRPPHPAGTRTRSGWVRWGASPAV